MTKDSETSAASKLRNRVKVLPPRSSYARCFNAIKTECALRPLIYKIDPCEQGTCPNELKENPSIIKSLTISLSGEDASMFEQHFRQIIQLDGSSLLENIPKTNWKDMKLEFYKAACQILISTPCLTNEVFVCFLKEMVLSQILKDGPLNRGIDDLVKSIIASRPFASLTGLIIPLITSTFLDKFKADMVCAIIVESFGLSLNCEFLKMIFSQLKLGTTLFSESLITVLHCSLKHMDVQLLGLDTLDTMVSVFVSESAKQPRSLALANLILTFVVKSLEKLDTRLRTILQGAMEKNQSHLKRKILKELSGANLKLK